MSNFLKNLFDKKKDKKYGKGHKLGDGTQPQPILQNQNYQPAYRPQTGSQSEASRMAGEAALARMTNKNTRPTTSSYKSQVSKEIEKSNYQDNEMKKALQLKDHYFGARSTRLEAAPVASNQIRFKASILGPNESYSREETEDRIEQTLLVQLDDEPILVSVTLLFTANYKTQEKLAKCIEILNKFINNILNTPSEEKYRKIRVENAIFKEKVYGVKYADLVLKKSGFKATAIKKSETNSEGLVIDSEEDYFIYEGDNLEKLENLKEALSLGEPIMPILDRSLKIFRVSSKSSVDCRKFDLSEDFYNIGVEELRKEHKIKMETIEKQGMLRNKAMRDRDEQLELRRYNYCLIRVRFPNDFILQAMFKSSETYEILYQFIQEQLQFDTVPFELFGHSLKKTVELSSTLAEAGLAPAALINFKWNENSITEAAQMSLNLDFYLKGSLIEEALMLE